MTRAQASAFCVVLYYFASRRTEPRLGRWVHGAVGAHACWRAWGRCVSTGFGVVQ